MKLSEKASDKLNHIFTGKQCMVDSGGYTMKWRRVKPNPWEVRRKSTVLGLGHANSSSVGYCAAAESAKPLHSGDSFYTTRQRKESRLSCRFYFTFTLTQRFKRDLLKMLL